MKILILSPISGDAVEKLRVQHSVKIYSKCDPDGDGSWSDHEAQVVIVRSGFALDRTRLENMQCLQTVIRAGVGTDNIDMEYLAGRNVRVIGVAQHHANAVAELTMGLFLDLARNITRSDRLMRSGVWGKEICTGIELRDKTVGIVGVTRQHITAFEPGIGIAESRLAGFESHHARDDGAGYLSADTFD